MARASGLQRLQSSVAVSDGTGRWHLVNASPDVTTQVERYLRSVDKPALRSSPLSEIFLTNADLDHSLGLLLLREGGPLRVTAPDGARQALVEGMRMEAVLSAFCGIEWIEAPGEWREIGSLHVRAVPLAESTAPRYAPAASGLHSVGYLFRDTGTGKQAGIFPDVPALNDELLAVLASCDVLLFDGTFWRDDELGCLGISRRTARDMGHVPIAGKGGSLGALAKLRRPACVYLHINNTNPMLDPGSPERREVEAAGLRVAEEGMVFDL
jgi:pyrroloquinoline quinone biosynthesis protein B